FPVPTPGMYQVKLFFAEKSANKAKPNARVFDVVIEGNLVLDDYDIFADAGFQVATEKTFEVFVRDDVINILFVHEVGDPILSAIEIASSGDDEPPAIFETSVSNRRDDVLDFPAQFEVPTKVTLSGNYPNPFRTDTAILLDLPKPATVQIDVFDMLGRKVDEKTAEQVMSGFQQEILFSAKDLQPGAYLYRVYIQDGLSQTIQYGRFVIIR
ncbi:MAG: malectin domain-containing carbohydrate-binding protein, partial [Rhodothermales bacterium]